MDRSELEKLPSHELHDRAVSHAVRHGDAGFLWSLIKAVPVAEAAAGHLNEAEADVMSVQLLLNDLVGSRRGELVDALRPMYIDYLAAHT